MEPNSSAEGTSWGLGVGSWGRTEPHAPFLFLTLEQSDTQETLEKYVTGGRIPRKRPPS